MFQLLCSRKYFSSCWPDHSKKVSYVTDLQTKAPCFTGLTARHRSQPFHSQMKDCSHYPRGELLPEALTPRRNLCMLFLLCHVHQVSSKHSSQLAIYHFPLEGIFSDHWIKAASSVHANSRSQSSMKE